MYPNVPNFIHMYPNVPVYPKVSKCSYKMYQIHSNVSNVPECNKYTQLQPNVPKRTKCTQTYQTPRKWTQVYQNVLNLPERIECTQMYQMYPNILQSNKWIQM